MKPAAVDVSVHWSCLRCPYKHAPLALCPASGVWLVLELCPACNERTGLYCRTHRDRHMPEPPAVLAPVLDMAEARRRIGEVA